MKTPRPWLILLALFVAAGVGWVHSPLFIDAISDSGRKAGDTPLSPITLRPAPKAHATPFHQKTSVRPPVAEAAGNTVIDDILLDPSTDFVAAAKRLAALAVDPARPAELRNEALAHAINLAAGNEAGVLMPLIVNPRLTEEQCRVLLDEALNQPVDWQVQAYLAALRVRGEPALRARIRAHLGFLAACKDQGDNPADWAEPLLRAAARREP